AQKIALLVDHQVGADRPRRRAPGLHHGCERDPAPLPPPVLRRLQDIVFARQHGSFSIVVGRTDGGFCPPSCRSFCANMDVPPAPGNAAGARKGGPSGLVAREPIAPPLPACGARSTCERPCARSKSGEGAIPTAPTRGSAPSPGFLRSLALRSESD